MLGQPVAALLGIGDRVDVLLQDDLMGGVLEAHRCQPERLPQQPLLDADRLDPPERDGRAATIEQATGVGQGAVPQDLLAEVDEGVGPAVSGGAVVGAGSSVAEIDCRPMRTRPSAPNSSRSTPVR